MEVEPLNNEGPNAVATTARWVFVSIVFRILSVLSGQNCTFGGTHVLARLWPNK
jgi:hypothetical protein